jgi:ketosteroid isomerase-like protein
MSAENVEVVRRMLDAFNRDDHDAVVAAFDEGCEIEEPLEMPDSPATGFRGHDGVRAWMGNLRGVAGARFEPRSFTPSGDLLLCELASRGVGRGSELPIEWMTFAVLQLRNGKIAQVRVFLDREEALAAAGLSR